jgi:hypothetical protein
MSDDPEFAAAVLRYRTHSCTLDDIDLFNSRVVMSLDNPHGLNLGSTIFREAAAIVAKNKTRQALNVDKARAITAKNNTPALICCHVKHTTNGRRQVRPDLHRHFLEAVPTSDNNKIRPPVLELFIGAPVIIRQGNLSVELGITTGAQGFVRGLELEQLESGDMHASVAIVEFPDADIQLDGLPKNHVPIKAVSGHVSQMMTRKDGNSQWRMEATRYQLPFELAFAITGHSAQGKTMNGVVCDLNTADVGGYIAASRARTRQGLVLIRDVTLQLLNVPLRCELVLEMRRLEALAHNTLVRFGYSSAKVVEVPDFEIEKQLPVATEVNVLVTVERSQAKNKSMDADCVSDARTLPKTMENNVHPTRSSTRLASSKVVTSFSTPISTDHVSLPSNTSGNRKRAYVCEEDQVDSTIRHAKHRKMRHPAE